MSRTLLRLQDNQELLVYWGLAGTKAWRQVGLFALRWKVTLAAGVAPSVILESTHQKALEFVTLDQLRSLE